MTGRAEQETIVSYMRDDPTVLIYTSNTTEVRRLRRLSALKDFVREIRAGDGWGEFEVSRASFSVLSAIREKRKLSDTERAARAARLARVRNGGTDRESDLRKRESN